MKKSTKVLLILLGCIVVVAGILIVIFRSQIFAQTTTTTDTKNNTSTKTAATEMPANVGKCQTGMENAIDSGFKVSVDCKTADEVNAAPLSGDKYTLSINYSIEFTKACKEYIIDPRFYENPGSSIDLPDADNRINGKDGETTKINGTIDHTFTVDEKYGYFVDLPIQREESIRKWIPTPPFYIWVPLPDVSEGDIQSNVCTIKRATNPEESEGEEIVSNVDDKAVTGGSTIEACKQKCGEAQKCGKVLKGLIDDPICNGFCSMSCYLLEMMAGLFNTAFGLLNSAVGLS